MKKLLVTLFLFISFLASGQTVNAPDAKSFLLNTSAQDASGFTLNGFTATDNLLCAIGLPTAPSGTTFYLTTTSGLTAASGFTLSGNKTKLVFTGTMANINTALASLKVNTTATAGVVQLSVSATVNTTGYYYNPNNGHFYKPIASGNSYTGARTASLLTTFKGQSGYLVTITSADEDNFIQLNVPQSNIWFAATDEVTEGVWIIDAGPEKGTIIKTSNGQLAGNVQGQYNNWAGGEPNNSGNEDYPVTKWGGGTQWNDLPNSFNCAYVIEYGTWTNPDNQTFTEFYSNSVSYSNGEALRTLFNFNFVGVDETNFMASIGSSVDSVDFFSNGANTALNGVGRVDLTSQIDVTQIAGVGSKGTIIPGNVEWSYMNYWNNTTYVYIDGRKLNGVQPIDVKEVKILDLYEGPVTFYSWDGTWAVYSVPSTVPKLTNGTSLYNSYIRNGGSYYAFMCDISFGAVSKNKYHIIQFSKKDNFNSTTQQSIYNNIVTISDVYLAFKQISDRGLFGNESKYFTTGIQFHNADVNEDGIFDESDCYKLLEHITGGWTKSILYPSPNLMSVIKITTPTTYDAITPQNWNTYSHQSLRNNVIPFTFINGVLNNYEYNVTWKGDVNLSHSPTPTGSTIVSNSMRTMSVTTNAVLNEVSASLMGENVGGKLVVTISVNPLQQELVGTQFQLNYDNTALSFEKVEFVTKGNPINFGTDMGDYIKLGSLVADGSTILDKTTEYKITFMPKIGLNGILGLTSVSSTDAVNKNGTQLKIKIN